MMICVSLLVILTSGSLTLLIQINRHQVSARDDRRSVREVRRLADDLRGLAHSSAAFEVGDEGRSVQLTGPVGVHQLKVADDGQWIEYQMDGSNEDTSTEPVSNVSAESGPSSQRRDRYWLGKNKEILFRASEDGARLICDIRSAAPGEPTLVIEGSLNASTVELEETQP